jgi:hypothetical protein
MPFTSTKWLSGSAHCFGGTVPSSGGTGTRNGPISTRFDRSAENGITGFWARIARR